MGSFKDLTGQTFGILYVLERDNTPREGKSRVYYKVRCLNCGNEYSARQDSIVRAPEKCPKCRYPILTNQIFGALKVIAPTNRVDAAGHKYWLCHCNDCGQEKEILGTHLLSGKQSSCGCLQYEKIAAAERKDITGQRFGRLTALELDKEKSKKQRSHWLCKCDCGNICSVSLVNLQNGHTTSCGCTKSIGEYTIRQILITNNINFKTEYKFPDLSNRRFDFAVFNNNMLLYLIEYDGIQHYQYSNTWHKTQENFLQAKKRDEEKNQYCKDNNIPLIRIPYWHLQDLCIEDLRLETSRFII